MQRPQPATLTDVASRAGVSVATASKALNSRDGVAAGTRRRVLAAADELSFRPNALARGLVSGRTGAVGLLTDELGGRFAIPILLGIESALGSGEMSVLLCDARGDPVRRRQHIHALLARQVDGFIVLGETNDVRPSLTAEVQVPVVYVYGESDHPADLSIVADDEGGARLAVEHLLLLGRRRIAHITGEESYRAARARASGVQDVLREAGLPLVGRAPWYGEWTRSWGRAAARRLLGAHPQIDGIFCGSDQVANGAVEAILELGRRIPDDVAVVGYDNWEVFSADCRPSLTTVDLNLQELGATAAAHLLDALAGRRAAGVIRLPGRLVVRESSGPAPGEGAVAEWLPESLWLTAEPLLPVAPSRPQGGGRRRASDRAVLAAILRRTASERSGRALPAMMFGVSRATVQRRLVEWQSAGVFTRLDRAVSDQLTHASRLNWSQPLLDAVAALAQGEAASHTTPAGR